MVLIKKGKSVWLLMIGLILCSNFAIYNTNVGNGILPAETNGIVLGSLLDLVILLPILFMLYKRKFTIKMGILLSATGCFLARFLIPNDLLEPFAAVTWAGIAIEAALIVFEVLLIVTFVRYLPKIVGKVSSSNLPVIFSFPQAVNLYVKKNPIIHMICSEALMLYYAFFSWKKTPPPGMTLYKNSSYIAFQIMMIHAIVIETLGIHLWLHEKSTILSLILLVLNIYSVVYFLADIQTTRLNPLYMNDQTMFISLGLLKRAEIQFENIELIIEDPEILEKKIPKDTIDFIVHDFAKVYPDMILYIKKPVKVTLFMGIQKEYSKIAIRSDSPSELKHVILEGIRKNK
ncbi:beta-carotene 15,15'-monooxygenase [Peribacillus simplex]|uniref:beta-carotene 15,15'-monooxygenase n=1 Tax=Peribacillus simplex TaxID=1478 RepID=UPI0024C20252|nr:beta-carotene 15,15'-monooxygenase [Peribacillus simplex]WHY58594.1 beta-carotene 15,15'-monooxygenase [Peribacillus simplex]